MLVCEAIMVEALKGRSTRFMDTTLQGLKLDDLIVKYLDHVAHVEPDYASNDPIVSNHEILAEVSRCPRTLFINIDEVQVR